LVRASDEVRNEPRHALLDAELEPDGEAGGERAHEQDAGQPSDPLKKDSRSNSGNLPPYLRGHGPGVGGVALALGGGVAKGWAHIGVLKAFREAQIPVSMIAGTSIGALVGGCYLAGKLDELEDFARSLTWSSVLRFMDFSLRGSGLISGERLAARMAQHMGMVRIEELDRPFVAVATDIHTGHEIWLHDGPLIEAIRASYALPGVFTPVLHNGRMLVDGALVNPVPVSAARAYEPDVVVAVDLNSENFGRGTVIRASHYTAKPPAPQPSKTPAWRSFFQSTDHHAAARQAEPHQPRTLAHPQLQPKGGRLGLTGVMIDSFNIIQDRIARARLAGDPPDYTIRPRLGGIGLADFHKADDAIRIGHAEGIARIRELEQQGEFAAV
jgi:NTE family protein